MAEKKDKLMAEYLAEPVKAGDVVLVEKKYLEYHPRNPEKKEAVKIKSIEGDNITIEVDEYGKTRDLFLNIKNIEKATANIGANPFVVEKWRGETRTVNFSLGCILTHLFPELSSTYDIIKEWKINNIPVKETNFNPYVIDKDGNKQYYQRPFVWTLEEKQLLIESIYRGLNCGQVLIRNRNIKEVTKAMENGDTEICCRDIVDGKQRINTIYEFVTDKFSDIHGNYYSDLSDNARWHFRDSQAFTYAEMGEGATDDDVIAAFLNVNFTGVPQSKEHIEYVENIAKLMK